MIDETARELTAITFTENLQLPYIDTASEFCSVSVRQLYINYLNAKTNLTHPFAYGLRHQRTSASGEINRTEDQAVSEMLLGVWCPNGLATLS